MWRVLPSTSSKQWIVVNRPWLQLLIVSRNIHVPCAQDNGKEFQKLQLHSSGGIGTVEWTEQGKYNSGSTLLSSDSAISRLLSDSMKRGDDFGTLYSEMYDVPTSSSSSPLLDSSTTSTTMGEFSGYSSQRPIDVADDGYDPVGLINTFTEAVSDSSARSSYHWISALEKCLLPNSMVTSASFKFYKCFFAGKRIGLRQKYLLLKRRLARQRIYSSNLAKMRQSENAKSLSAMISADSDTHTNIIESVDFYDGPSLHSTSVNKKNAQKTSFNAKCSSSVIRRDRFDPLDVRAKVAPVSELFRLTRERDIGGLRAILNEYRWPKISSLRAVISELLKTFVELAADVEEVKQLIWDFAATDNRAYIADSVTLIFLERIIRENGIQSAETYARQHRDLFLVRPPMERNKRELKDICNRLFITALENTNVDEARNFIDLLIELGYLENNDDFFVLSLSEQLKRSNYSVAYSLWTFNVKYYRNSIGIHLLIRNILATTNVKQQAKLLEELFEVALKNDHPHMALGELAVELVRADRILEAEVLVGTLTLSGRHLSVPLKRLKGKSENLIYLERISDVVSKCLIAEKKAKHGKKKLGDGGLKEVQRIDNISSLLISKWTSKKRKKFMPSSHKVKRFTLDAVQLNELSLCIQDVWTDIADVGNDISALERMFEWCEKNGLKVQNTIIRKCMKIYERNGVERSLGEYQS